MRRVTNLAVCLAAAQLACLTGCESKPTPPPFPSGSIIPVKVHVFRDQQDASQPPPNQCIGYIWDNFHVRDMVNQALSSQLMAGTRLNFLWDGYVNEKWLNFEEDEHVWSPYVVWIPLVSNQTEILNDPDSIHIVFVGGILDSQVPARFMDSYTLDPALNNDPFWINYDPQPRPVILISDCWVPPSVSGDVYGKDWQGIIPKSVQLQETIIERALARWALRLEDWSESDPNWDKQEYWTGANPTYMSWWNQRVATPVAQPAVRDKFTTSPFAP